MENIALISWVLSYYMNHISSKLPFLTFFLRFVAVGLFIISQGIIENKMKEFFIFYF